MWSSIRFWWCGACFQIRIGQKILDFENCLIAYIMYLILIVHKFIFNDDYTLNESRIMSQLIYGFYRAIMLYELG